MALVMRKSDRRRTRDEQPESDVMTYSSTVVIVSVLVGIVVLVIALWLAA
jgi:hypothetical protein